MIPRVKMLERVLDRLLTTPEEAMALTKLSGSPTPAGKLSASHGSRKHDEAAAPPPIVYLLLDVSESMDAEKLRQAKRGALSFAKDAIAKRYEVGVIQFTSWARVKTEPTRKLSAIRAGLSEVGLQAGTNIAFAIELATGALAKTRGLRAMVLVTDGYPDDTTSALAAAKDAKQLHDITIIAIGTEDSDRDFLKKIATASELATTVPDEKLEVAIAKAAGLLPAKTSG